MRPRLAVTSGMIIDGSRLGAWGGRLRVSPYFPVGTTYARHVCHRGGRRTSQNWIGGSNYSPHGAAFIPPPEAEVDRLLTDLATFMNRDDLSPTLRAAIPHS